MKTITPDDVAIILESAWEMRDEIVPCLLGAPGIGKTQGIYDFARSKGAKVVEIIASQILPNEVSGITMPVNETHSMEIYDHARLASLKDGDILFFDELLQASTQTLSACLTLIQERRMMSGKKLPDIMIVAAANPLGSPNALPLSIRQRFMFIDVAWNRTQWMKWVRKNVGCNVSDDLLHLMSEGGEDQYNVLTPRTAAKLLAWGLKSNCSEGWEKAVSNMFDLVTVNALKSSIEQPTTQHKIGEVIRESDIDISPQLKELLDKLDEIEVADILEKLQAMDEWPDIEKVLATTN